MTADSKEATTDRKKCWGGCGEIHIPYWVLGGENGPAVLRKTSSTLRFSRSSLREVPKRAKNTSTQNMHTDVCNSIVHRLSTIQTSSKKNIGMKAWYNRLTAYCSTTKWNDGWTLLRGRSGSQKTIRLLYGSIFKEMLRIGESTGTESGHVVVQERNWQKEVGRTPMDVMFALKQRKAVFMMVAQSSEFTEHQLIICTLSVDELGGVWIMSQYNVKW